MREPEIREALATTLRAVHPDPTETLIIEELGVYHGAGRVDLAAVNGSLHGFEIKSDGDRLTRLPRQVELYGRVVDYMTLVCAPRHLEAAAAMIPDWWGIVVIDRSNGLLHQRAADNNPGVEAFAVLHLLWRAELVDAARALHLPRVARSNRRELMARIAAALSLDDAKALTRSALKSREGWRDP